MYWWNVSKLAQDLRAGWIDEKERSKYYIATFLAFIMAVPLLIYLNGTEKLIYTVTSFVAAVVGIILCHRVNRNGDNTDFIARMICLGWPVGIRLVVMFLGYSFLRGLITATPTDSLLVVIYILCFYGDMYHRIAFVAKAQTLENVFETREAPWSGGEIALAIVGGIGVPITMILSMNLASDLADTPFGFVICLLAVGLWMLLIGSFLVRLRRRSMKGA